MLGICCVTKLHVAAEAALAVCGRYILLACKRVKKHPAITTKKEYTHCQREGGAT